MDDFLIPARHVHVAAGLAWFGEVLVINFVLIPALGRMDLDGKRLLLGAVFPKLFRMASVLSATAVIAGGFVLLVMTDGKLGLLTQGRWGLSVLVGGSLATALTLFHFFMENRLAKRIGIGCDGKVDSVLNDVHLKLKVVPRLGLAVIASIAFLMVYAVRGI